MYCLEITVPVGWALNTNKNNDNGNNNDDDFISIALFHVKHAHLC